MAQIAAIIAESRKGKVARVVPSRKISETQVVSTVFAKLGWRPENVIVKGDIAFAWSEQKL